MYPFLFVKEDRSKFFVVISKHFDYEYYNSEWLSDEEIGDSCCIPSASLEESKHKFSTEREALMFIKNWWMNHEI